MTPNCKRIVISVYCGTIQLNENLRMARAFYCLVSITLYSGISHSISVENYVTISESSTYALGIRCFAINIEKSEALYLDSN